MQLHPILASLIAFSFINLSIADPEERLSITSPTQNNYLLSWIAANQRQYQLESSPDLQNWTALGSSIMGAGALVTITDSSVVPNKKFYRLRIGAVRAGFNSNILGRNDDGSTGLVSLGFSIDLFGTTYTNCYVNNNGNITFDNPLGTYTPYPLQHLGFPIIAPFWADVDTRAPGSNLVQYSYGVETIDGHAAFGVNYINVGYFDVHDDKLNSFQLVLINRSDTGTGNFDIEFNYSKIVWETGDASSGSNGYGGFPCRVGLSNGSDRTIELAHSGETLQFLDTILSSGLPNYATGLIYQTRNSTCPGRLVFQVRGGSVLGALSVNAGPDQALPSNQTTTTLAGAASNPSGGSVTTHWSILQGPLGATFSDASSLTSTITLPSTGEYIVQLTATSVSDPQITAADTLTITNY